MVSRTYLEKMMALAEAHYQCTSQALERVLDRPPLAYERSNLQVVVDLFALKTELALHMRTTKQLLEVLDLVEQLRKELLQHKSGVDIT